MSYAFLYLIILNACILRYAISLSSLQSLLFLGIGWLLFRYIIIVVIAFIWSLFVSRYTLFFFFFILLLLEEFRYFVLFHLIFLFIIFFTISMACLRFCAISCVLLMLIFSFRFALVNIHCHLNSQYKYIVH